MSLSSSLSTAVWCGLPVSNSSLSLGYVTEVSRGAEAGHRFPNVYMYKCLNSTTSTPFYSVGTTRRQCLATGQWSGQEPVCKCKWHGYEKICFSSQLCITLVSRRRMALVGSPRYQCPIIMYRFLGQLPPVFGNQYSNGSPVLQSYMCSHTLSEAQTQHKHTVLGEGNIKYKSIMDSYHSAVDLGLIFVAGKG